MTDERTRPRDALLAEIEALAREKLAEAEGDNKGYQYLSGERDNYPAMVGCVAAIRETLKRAPQVRWPGEALAAMEQAREALGMVRPSTKVAEAKRVRSIATLTEQIERMRNEQG
jgi:hypothetical protein